jgi:predicted nucleic acid-binding protein
LSEIWIANASPIIVLTQCGYLDLLTKLSSKVVVPQAVVEEIIAGTPSDPARVAIENGWGDRAVPQSIATDLLEWGLGRGRLRY